MLVVARMISDQRRYAQESGEVSALAVLTTDVEYGVSQAAGCVLPPPSCRLAPRQ